MKDQHTRGKRIAAGIYSGKKASLLVSTRSTNKCEEHEKIPFGGRAENDRQELAHNSVTKAACWTDCLQLLTQHKKNGKETEHERIFLQKPGNSKTERHQCLLAMRGTNAAATAAADKSCEGQAATSLPMSSPTLCTTRWKQIVCHERYSYCTKCLFMVTTRNLPQHPQSGRFHHSPIFSFSTLSTQNKHLA